MPISALDPVEAIQTTTLRERAARLVAAYVANNAVPHENLPVLISTVSDALLAIQFAPSAASLLAIERPTPTEIRNSIRPEGIVSFIDGRTYRTLKRHLTAHGLNPQSYRDRYGLPRDYPMTAPSYAAKRSEIARAMRLGHKAI